jgi:Pycsar effector protein
MSREHEPGRPHPPRQPPERPAGEPQRPQPVRPPTASSAGRGPFAPPELPPIPTYQPEPDDGEEDGGKKKKKKKNKKGKLGSERGIETMFRNSYRTHIDMSGLADSKSNIMISINGLIMSIIIASISPGIDTNPWLLLPTSVLLIGCLASLVFAVLAARPRVTSRVVTLEDVRASRANILFFGSFVNLPEEDYITGMTELMQNPDELYLNMMRDLYGLGNVLQRKFRLLWYAYNLFMGGLATGVIAFIIVLITVALRSPVSGG